jgi:predicted acylesterase/phospholipase RssA
VVAVAPTQNVIALPNFHFATEMRGAQMQKRIRRVLSIDGGGVRGILPALFLRAFEEHTKKSTSDLFDLAIGTSTGGLIALALTHSRRALTAREMLDLYVSHGNKIFGSPRSSFVSTFFRPRYNNNGLRELGALLFGEGRLAEAKIPTAVTAYDIVERRPRVLKSWKAAKDVRRDCYLWEAALATSAAPTYFPAVKIGERTLIDGGVFANNPSAIALAEARFMWPDDEVLLVSLGTGIGAKLGHLPDDVNSWGSLQWVVPLMDCMFDGSSDSIDYVAKALLGSNRYYRFQITIHPDLVGMDNVSKSHLEQLRAAGAREVDKQKNDISGALNHLMAVFGGKADMTFCTAHVCF